MKEYRHGSSHKNLQNVGLGRPEEGRMKESGATTITKTSPTHGLSWPLRLMTATRAAAAVTKSPATETRDAPIGITPLHPQT